MSFLAAAQRLLRSRTVSTKAAVTVSYGGVVTGMLRVSFTLKLYHDSQ